MQGAAHGTCWGRTGTADDNFVTIYTSFAGTNSCMQETFTRPAWNRAGAEKSRLSRSIVSGLLVYTASRTCEVSRYKELQWYPG